MLCSLNNTCPYKDSAVASSCQWWRWMTQDVELRNKTRSTTLAMRCETPAISRPPHHDVLWHLGLSEYIRCVTASQTDWSIVLFDIQRGGHLHKLTWKAVEIICEEWFLHGHFNPWRWDHYVVSKRRAPTIQWRDTTFQNENLRL